MVKRCFPRDPGQAVGLAPTLRNTRHSTCENSQDSESSRSASFSFRIDDANHDCGTAEWCETCTGLRGEALSPTPRTSRPHTARLLSPEPGPPPPTAGRCRRCAPLRPAGAARGWSRPGGSLARFVFTRPAPLRPAPPRPHVQDGGALLRWRAQASGEWAVRAGRPGGSEGPCLGLTPHCPYRCCPGAGICHASGAPCIPPRSASR